MPARRPPRDPYRTPSPPPLRYARPLYTRHGSSEAELLIDARPTNSSASTKVNLTEHLQHGKHSSSNAYSHVHTLASQNAMSTDSSPCSVPSLSMMPSPGDNSTITSYIQDDPYPEFECEFSPSYEPYENVKEIENALKFPKPFEDASAGLFSDIRTSLGLVETTVEFRPRHLRLRSHSLSTIAATFVVLQRCIRNRINGHHAEFESPASQTRPREISTEIMSTLQNSEKPDISSWLLRSLRSEGLSSNSDTDSIGSFESDNTTDGSGDGIDSCRGDVPCWPSEADPRDFLIPSRRILSHLPSGVAASISSSLCSLFDSWIARLVTSQQTSNNAASSGSSSSYSQQNNSTKNTCSSFNGKKRGPYNEDDGLFNSGNNALHKKQKFNGETEADPRQKWACPFYQREPHRYCVETEVGDFRKCARSPGFDQVHRVNLFKEEEQLEIHRRMDPACELQQPPVIEGLTTKQKALLKPRDRKSKSDEERWNVIYKICFPGDEILPSPCKVSAFMLRTVVANNPQDYIHYSREIAELRREVLEIVREETTTPAAVNANRLIQRLQEAFNAQLPAESPSSLIPQTPAVLTPSTTNESGRSTDVSFSQGQRRVPYQESPSVTRTSQQVALVTTFSADDLTQKSTSRASSNGSPAGPLDNRYPSSSNNDHSLSGFVSPISFNIFDDNSFNADQFMLDMGRNTTLQLDDTNFEPLDDTCTES
ncbi:hypothetical protein B7463_g5654, partial [Scytalidium lignicola]